MESDKDVVNKLKYKYIKEILQTENQKAANALVAYASFMNSQPLKVDHYPLLLQILETNNKYAIDALVDGSEPEAYLDFVIPNGFILKAAFEIFYQYKIDEIYEITLRIFCGLFLKVYQSPEEGFQVYQPTIANINNLTKFLDESKDQDYPLNRDILDILLYITDLRESSNQEIKDLAWQAGRLRSDFFDSERGLKQSLPSKILEKAGKQDFGIRPEYTYK